MALITVDRETCTQCGACAVVCPAGIIAFKKGGYPRSITPGEPFCLICGHCVAACPSGSLSHRDMPLSECRPIEEDLKITPAQCEQLIKHRRSIRAYRDKPVARDVITRLIDVARYAPTGHNAQEVEWLVLDDQEELQRLESIGTDWIRWVIKNQPQMAAIMNMGMLLRRQEKVPTTFLRGAPVLIVAHAASPIATVDCTIALSYLDLFANTKGLGCCWAGFVYIMANSFPAMKEALAIPEGHTAGGCMMLGYPKFRYHRIPVRRPAKIQWHD